MKYSIKSLNYSFMFIMALFIIIFFIPGCSDVDDSSIPSDSETLRDTSIEESVSSKTPVDTDYKEDLEWELLAREGEGALYEKGDRLLLVVRGSPYDMGYQHGVLLKEKVQELSTRVVEEVNEERPGYLAHIWDIQKDIIPERFLEEMQGLSDGAQIELEKIQLANIMPELFHCSAIALFGQATDDGALLHARILDYMVDHGLQDYKLVIVAQPDGHNAFINATFTGFIGSVTGMNDKHIAIGEMGGSGLEEWEGIPMPFLMRMVLEQAYTLDDGIDVFTENPRTCEYYYMISDSKSMDAVGIYATPDMFVTVRPGQEHPLLPLPLQEDTLIMSGHDRFLLAHERIEQNYGSIDKNVLIEIMKRPVSMESNLHNAIFCPASLTMWLAVAKDPSIPDFQACFQPYHEYSLEELLNLE